MHRNGEEIDKNELAWKNRVVIAGVAGVRGIPLPSEQQGGPAAPEAGTASGERADEEAGDIG